MDILLECRAVSDAFQGGISDFPYSGIVKSDECGDSSADKHGLLEWDAEFAHSRNGFLNGPARHIRRLKPHGLLFISIHTGAFLRGVLAYSPSLSRVYNGNVQYDNTRPFRNGEHDGPPGTILPGIVVDHSSVLEGVMVLTDSAGRIIPPGFYVYRLWGDCGRSLYIGKSRKPSQRITQHSESNAKTWWPDVRRMDLFVCDSLREMDTVERIQLWYWRPEHCKYQGSWQRGIKYFSELPYEYAPITDLIPYPSS